jgi:hypothetical protein
MGLLEMSRDVLNWKNENDVIRLCEELTIISDKDWRDAFDEGFENGVQSVPHHETVHADEFY